MSRKPVLALTAAALAALALGLSGCGGDDDSADAPAASTAAPATTAPAGTAPAGGAPTALALDADPGGSLAFVQTALSAPAGPVTITLTNDSPVPHNVAVKGGAVDSPPSEVVQDGGTADLTVDLPAGAYEFYCEVPGHEAAGMKGTLTVE